MTYCLLRNPALLLALFLGIVTTCTAQVRPNPQDKPGRDDGLVDFGYLVAVDVSVTDRTGADVSDLAKNDFVIYEDGKQQTLFGWEAKAASADGRTTTQYRLYYEPPTNRLFDGTYRRIRVVVRRGRGPQLRVGFKPKGYYSRPDAARPRKDAPN